MEPTTDGYEAALAAELTALQARLLDEHRKATQVVRRSGATSVRSSAGSMVAPRETSRVSILPIGPKLIRPASQGLSRGDETNEAQEVTGNEESCDLLNKAADEAKSIPERWLLLSIKLSDLAEQEEEEGINTVAKVPGPGYRRQESHHNKDGMTLLPAWNGSLHESYKQQRRTKRRSLRGVSMKMNEKLRDNTCLQPYIVVPSSPERVAWTFLSFIFIVWDLITVPMSMFDIPGFSGVLDLLGKVTFGYFMADVCLQFIFAVDIKGQLEMRPAAIARAYIRSWFPLDVLLLLIDILLFVLEGLAADAASGLKSVRLLRSLRLLRLMRLLRIGRLKQVMTLLANRFSSLYFLMIMKILSGFAMVLAVNHFVACSWYGVGLLNVDTVSWLTEASMEEASFAEGYIVAMHWSLTQFTPATNNVAPANYLERMFAVFVILLAMGVFSSFISSITAAVNSLRAVRMEQLKQESKIRQFFNERSLSAELFGKVQECCRKRGLFEIRLKEEEVLLLQEIPESLKRRLHEEIFQPLLSVMPIFPAWSHNQEYRFMRKVCHLAMREVSALSSQDVFILSAESKEVLAIQQGSPGYFVRSQDSSRVQDSVEFEVRDRTTVPEGEFLCLPCLFANWTHRGKLTADRGTAYYVGLRSETFCNLIKLHRGPLYQYLQIYGILFVSVIEAQDDQGADISDLPLPDSVMDSLAKRSQRFADIMNAKDKNTAVDVTKTSKSWAFHDDGPMRIAGYSSHRYISEDDYD